MGRYQRSAVVLVGAGIALAGTAGAATIAPGDARFVAIVGQLLRAGATAMSNDPSCPGVADNRRRVGLGTALAGALAREGAGGAAIGLALTCADTPSARRKECRFVASSTDPDAESSAGVSFELSVPRDRVILSTLRCTVTP